MNGLMVHAPRIGCAIMAHLAELLAARLRLMMDRAGRPPPKTFSLRRKVL